MACVLSVDAVLTCDHILELLQYQELRRPPGDEIRIPVYSEQMVPTQFHHLPLAERKRQLDAARVRIYGVLLVDGHFVCSTALARLHPFDFCVQLNTSLQLHLQQVCF